MRSTGLVLCEASSGYFLNHSIGRYPGKERALCEATATFAQIWWPRALAGRAEFVALWERLIGAPEGTVTTAESVTAALYSVLGGLPDERLSGKRVLIAANCFPSLHFLLSGFAARRGFTLDTVPLREGESWVREEDMPARLGPDVALTLVTLVNLTAGYRADLDDLLPEIRAAGSLVALDLTQGIGVVPFSVADHAPDIVVSASLKWMGCAGSGDSSRRALRAPVQCRHARSVGRHHVGARPAVAGGARKFNPFWLMCRTLAMRFSAVCPSLFRPRRPTARDGAAA